MSSLTGNSADDQRVVTGLERHHIDVVSPAERHGKARSLFYIWFGSNMNLGSVLTGAVAIYVGNNLFWALVAIVVGNLIGSIFMALHAAQGPKLGVPQLIQGRGQFGFHGAIIPVIIAIFMYIGFGVLAVDPSGQAMGVIGLSIGSATASAHIWIVILSIPVLGLALLGYDHIHWAQRFVTYLTLILFALVLTISVLVQGIPSLSPGGFHAADFMLAVSIFIAFQVTYAVYVSDYTRYLPEDVGAKGPIVWSFLGTNVSSIWAMVLGAVLVTQYAKLGPVEAAYKSAGADLLAAIMLIAAVIGGLGGMALNVYGGALGLITGTSSFKKLPPETAVRVRAVSIVLIWCVVVAVGVGASKNFLSDFTNFLNVLAYVFLPWSVINLIDFYLIKHGEYDVPALFEAHGRYGRDPAGGVYGGFALPACIAYVIALAAEVPFVNSAWLVGPIAKSLGGADIAWIVGTVVAGVSYWVLGRRWRAQDARPGASREEQGITRDDLVDGVR